MRSLLWVGVVVAALVGLSWAAAGDKPPPLKVDKGAPLLLDEPNKEPPPKPGSSPPLKVDRAAPLLLDEPGGAATKHAADNSACHVCHVNYQDESLATKHAAANVGCVACHGSSDAHRNDEANITPPDKIFAPGKIDAACRKCHEAHDVPAAKVVARWQEKCPGRVPPASAVCTDCHGEHRMAVRTIRWDKETKKLLPREARP